MSVVSWGTAPRLRGFELRPAPSRKSVRRKVMLNHKLRKLLALAVSAKRWSGGTTTGRVMRSPRVSKRLVLLLPLFVGASNLRCGPPGLCHPEHQGKTFTVTILKRASLFGCPLPDPDPLIGQSFAIRIDGTGFNGRDCDCGTGPIVSSPSVVSWSNARARSCVGNIYDAAIDVRLGECATSASLALFADFPSSSEPNEMGGELYYGDNTCLCGGAFQVAIREISDTAAQ